jgi:sorting nexin-1/2
LSALRRFSDFLWLVEALTSNNPGIVIPPVPDKHTFGRFQEQFIETRRLALERSLTKITSHPVLQLDPDLRLFLESDNFAVESRARRPVVDTAPEQRGLLSGWTGPRFVESDDWFVSRSAFLDSLEAQLRGLSKAIEVSSKARLDYAIALGESAESMTRLAESDLGSAMCAALARLADLGRTEKEAAEELAKGDVINLLNVADEYIRFIGTVRVAMQARTKGWFAWQSHVKEANRFKATREKMRAQGKLGDRAAQSLAEANEVSLTYMPFVCALL